MIHEILCSLAFSMILTQGSLSVDSAAEQSSKERNLARPESVDRPKIPTEIRTVEQGRLRGLVVGERGDVHAYKGIPYAAPPTGVRRWKPPQPPGAWEGVRDCYSFGPACPQKYSPFLSVVPLAAIKSFSEDCLTLNVYRPATPSPSKLPVMVWIHGGAYTEGSSSQGIYDGVSLARKGIVLVTINYRLGPFGFGAHPALSAESEQKISGNYGILDQIAALRWVQKNIGAFGGDPKRVTIFGESAGGGSVICLLISPQAKGLFQRAIAQSTPEMTLPHLNEEYSGRESAEQQGKRLIARCGLSEDADADALRQLPTEKLVDVFPTLQVVGQKVTLDAIQLPIGPVVDEVIIPEDPNAAFAAGRFHQVPLMTGITRDEAAAFLMFVKIPTEKSQYQSLVTQEFGGMAHEILSHYAPAAEAKVIRATSVQLLTDLIYGAQARLVAQKSAKAGQETYKYVFSRGSRVPMLATVGAHHGCEVPYVFGLDHPVWNWADWDRKLSDLVGQYWVNFAATGNPNGPGLPPWPAYALDTEKTLELGDEVIVLEKYRGNQLDVIDTYLRTRVTPTEDHRSK